MENIQHNTGNGNLERNYVVKLVEAQEMDAKILTQIQIDAYSEEVAMYGAGPQGYDSEEATLRRIKCRKYFKIVFNGSIVGGVFIFYPGGRLAVLDGIFVKKELQGKGIAVEAVKLLEAEFPEVEIWSTETPIKSYSNHRFYEKLGYIKIGEKDDFLVLYHKNTHKCDKEKAEYIGSEILEAEFANVNMAKAEFDYANIANSGFTHANFEGTNFLYSSMNGIKAYDCNLTNANFKNVNFGKTETEGKTVFANCDLSGCFINESDLENMNISFSNMSGMNISNVWLGGANFQYAAHGQNGKPVKFTNCDLTGSGFNECSLKNAKIDNCDISGMTINGIPVDELIREYMKTKENSKVEE